MRAMICGGLVSVMLSASVLAGPLTPPVGPVAPTAKPLAEVEPRIAINLTNTPGDADSLFKITQRGSYYLTGNINGVSGRHGIEIAASGVTIDLNGFDVLGGAGTLDGVTVTTDTLRNISVRNGSVRNWGGDGVDLDGGVAISVDISHVVDLRVSGNAGRGIVTDPAGTIARCTVYNNDAGGIVSNGGATITECVARENGGIGIETAAASLVTGCRAASNTGIGISVGECSTVTDCTAYLNTGDGINAGPGGTISGCSTAFNNGNGISSTVGSTISNCTSRANDGDGIRVVDRCLVLANTCNFNGNGPAVAFGIQATGNGNRIEGNTCSQSDRGIKVTGTGNVIIRNTCSGNLINWEIAANNVVGPILDRTAPASAAILGNSAPESTGSSHPNANFSH